MLGGLSKKFKSDDRWLRLYNRVVKKLGPNPPQFSQRKLYRDLADISEHDADFAHFGICIPKVSKADSKKIKPKQVIAEKNHWFRFRKLFDNHMRADIAVAMYVLGMSNAYQVKKVIRCSQETAYRQYKSLNDPVIAKQIAAIINVYD